MRLPFNLISYLTLGSVPVYRNTHTHTHTHTYIYIYICIYIYFFFHLEITSLEYPQHLYLSAFTPICKL